MSTLVKKRLFGLDVFRGYAVVFMVIFHFVYDLNHFGYVDINVFKERFWVTFRIVIVGMFLFAAGVSLKLSHPHCIKTRKLYKRLAILGVAAVLVSVVSYLQFPKSWIYFGVLHFIFVASLLGLLFLNRPILGLMGAMSVSMLAHFGYADMHWLFEAAKSVVPLPDKTKDILRLFPWFGIVLMGIVVAHFEWHYTLFQNRLFTAKNHYNHLLAWGGRSALPIYLLHQPLFFGGFLLIQ